MFPQLVKDSFGTLIHPRHEPQQGLGVAAPLLPDIPKYRDSTEARSVLLRRILQEFRQMLSRSLGDAL
jgi:hypothetical protein